MTMVHPKRKRYKSNYSSEDMHKAIQSVTEGKMSTRMAAHMYNIPRSTLQDKLSLHSPVDTRPGPKQILSSQEEGMLIDTILKRMEKGEEFSVSDLRLSIKDILDRDQRPNPFKNNSPGRHFLNGFMERHPEIGKVSGSSVLVPSTGSSPEPKRRTAKKKESFSPSEKALALKVIESMMNQVTLKTYKNIYMSGISLPTDEFYNIWKGLREFSLDRTQSESQAPKTQCEIRESSSQEDTESPSESSSPKRRIVVKLARRKRRRICGEDKTGES